MKYVYNQDGQFCGTVVNNCSLETFLKRNEWAIFDTLKEGQKFSEECQKFLQEIFKES